MKQTLRNESRSPRNNQQGIGMTFSFCRSIIPAFAIREEFTPANHNYHSTTNFARIEPVRNEAHPCLRMG
ncbi:hypothetical protein I7I50_08410 [Histoplasma capsulatum G186AR]|uniref:Uncharacterized protein n=1 Tax=Ajellomyces capsulatus TaxID=5037 RepID=A0A8H8CYX0_AJECA|nr:hypothetical protein I7I52_05926 [Histoplasma capsulatum]QSS73587.1 hypothetical protein I7I50_08410 [Histoplasma capsulatum G186AR]